MAAAVLVVVLGFAGSLATGEFVSRDPVWTKALKDLPLLALVAYLYLTLRRQPARRPLVPSLRMLLVAIGAMAIVMVSSAVFIEAPSVGFFVSARYYIIYPLLAVGVALRRWSEDEVARIAGLAVLLAIVQLPLLALEHAHVFGRTAYYGGVEIFGQPAPRVVGTLGNPNYLARFLFLAAILVLTNAAPTPPRWRYWVLTGLGVGLFLTFGKATTGLFLMLAVVAWREGTWRHVPRACVAAAGAAGASTLLFRSDAVLSGRPTTYAGAFEAWSADALSFVMGTGFARVIRTDSMFLALGVEGGLLAIVGFAGVVVAALSALWRVRKNGPFQRATLVVGVVTAAYMPIEGIFRVAPNALLFWLFAGLALGSVAVEGRRGHAPSPAPGLGKS